MWSPLQAVSENPPPLSSSTRGLIHVFASCTTLHCITLGCKGTELPVLYLSFYVVQWGENREGCFNSVSKCSEADAFRIETIWRKGLYILVWKALSTFVLTVERQINTIVT